MSHGEDAGAEIFAVVGGNPTKTDTGVDGPLLALTPAVLVAEVSIYIQVFALITLVLFSDEPLEVVVTSTYAEADVPAVDEVMLHAVAEPVAELQAYVTTLVCVGVVVPYPPGPEDLTLDTPAVLGAEGNLDLCVRSNDAPQQEVGLEGDDRCVVNGVSILRTAVGQVDDGVADDERVAATLLLGHRHDDSRTRGAEGC